MNPAPAALRVVVDRRTCVGTTNCVEAAPDAYSMTDDNVPVVVAGAAAASLIEGACACPVGAITCYDSVSGQRIAP